MGETARFLPPIARCARIGGKPGVGCEVGVLLFVSVVQIARTRPPRLRRCPPGLVGFLARNLASRFASGALMKLIAVLETPECKTPTPKKPRDRPTPGGSAEGTGGVSSQSARPATRSPPLGGSAERSEARGACHTLCSTHKKPPCELKTAHPTPSLPPSRDRRSRYRGAADERERGPRGVIRASGQRGVECLRPAN